MYSKTPFAIYIYMRHVIQYYSKTAFYVVPINSSPDTTRQFKEFVQFFNNKIPHTDPSVNKVTTRLQYPHIHTTAPRSSTINTELHSKQTTNKAKKLDHSLCNPPFLNRSTPGSIYLSLYTPYPSPTAHLLPGKSPTLQTS